MKAIIRNNPFAKYSNQAEIIESVDISHCIEHIRQLRDIAKFVNENPSGYDSSAALIMAHLILEIEIAITPSY